MLANLWDGAQNFATAWGDYLEAEAQGLALNTADEPYENSRSETDQIIAFFEREFDGREEIFGPFMDEEQSVQLTQLRVKYLNCTNSIDHQNEQITVAMEDMFAKRAEFTGLLHTCPSTIRLGRLTAQAVAEVNHLPQTAPLLRSLETLKLDINDRKNTRFFKERERQDTAEPLAAAIANIKIGQFESCKLQAKEGHQTDYPCATDAAHKRDEDGVGGAGRSSGAASDRATAGGAYITGETVRRRGGRRRYTDEEISAALKAKLF